MKKDKVSPAERAMLFEIAYIPEESAPLAGLGLVNRDVAQRLGRRCPEQRNGPGRSFL